MRRLLTVVLALVVVASLSFAATNEVTSVNAVGYVTVTVPAGSFRMIGVSFDAFDATLDGVLGDALRPDPEGEDPDAGDQAWLWNGSEYVRYYRDVADGLIYKFPHTQENPTLAAGDGLWFKTPSSGPLATTNQVVLAGEVVDAATVALGLASGYQQVCYAYSADIMLADTTLKESGTPNEEDPDSADQLWTWNDEYVRYWLSDDGGGVRTWRTFGGAPAVVELPIGGGFWYKAQSGFTWSEDCPYTSNL